MPRPSTNTCLPAEFHGIPREANPRPPTRLLQAHTRERCTQGSYLGSMRIKSYMYSGALSKRLLVEYQYKRTPMQGELSSLLCIVLSICLMCVCVCVCVS